MLEVKFGTPKNLEEMSFQGRLRHRHLWLGAQETTTHLPNFQQLHLRGVGEGLAVVPLLVGWVATGGVFSLGLESLGITLAASPIHHAST
jgi:hypothetical protein